MAGKFSRSWALMKASAAVLQSDKSLLVFPLLSGLCTLLVAASFLVPVGIMMVAITPGGTRITACRWVITCCCLRST